MFEEEVEEEEDRDDEIRCEEDISESVLEYSCSTCTKSFSLIVEEDEVWIEEDGVWFSEEPDRKERRGN